MKASLHSRYGPADRLQIQDIECPIPRSDEILVKIHAATVSSGDCNIRNFTFVSRFMRPLAQLMFGVGKPWKPRVLGTEVAGEVVGTGSGVTRFQIGDPVVASTGMMGGGHAQYICLREDSVVTLKPESLSWQEAVAIPFGANTALVFLQDCARLEAGQTVLIIGASGSVGSAAVQLAKHLGATVTAVCSGANAELVKSLGADQVVDYTREDFTALPATYDIVFDVVGASSFAQCQAVLNPRGVFLPCILSLSDMMWIPWTAVRPGKRIRGSVAMQDVGRLQLILGLADIGVLRPVIDRTYPLDDIAEAFKYVELGHKRGNVVITVVHS